MVMIWVKDEEEQSEMMKKRDENGVMKKKRMLKREKERCFPLYPPDLVQFLVCSSYNATGYHSFTLFKNLH